jgi:membrane protein
VVAVAAFVFVFVGVLLLGLTPQVEARLSLSFWRWPALLLADFAMLWALYRFAPCPDREARRRPVVPGAFLATALSLAFPAGFSWYVADMANLQAIYGPAGATVAFMFWTWLTVIAVLAGGELNGELERRARCRRPPPMSTASDPAATAPSHARRGSRMPAAAPLDRRRS